jgi:hypothetical protein
MVLPPEPDALPVQPHAVNLDERRRGRVALRAGRTIAGEP